MPSAAAPAPLIVTAILPHEVHRWASELRRRHFPPERNHLEAHVTLFHALPPSSEAEVRAALASEAAACAPPAARIERLLDLGRGTALRVDCPPLLDLRARLAERFHGLLTAQDSHRPRLHVTIQNKVSRGEALALQSALPPTLVRRAFAFTGLGLHIYAGGPWRAAGNYPFRSG